MNRLIISLVCLLTAFQTCYSQSGKISKEEREFITNFMTTTHDQLLATLENVDDRQWEANPITGGWSVAYCMEHIILAENAVFGQVKKALAEPANKNQSTKAIDGWLLGKVTDRGVKVETPLPPKANGKSKAEMIAEFQASRKVIADFIQNDKSALRNHFGKSPYGPADAYQLLIVISAHTMRHTNQMIEVLNTLNQ